MEEKSVNVRKFGDERSALLDLFERRSFEMQLSRAVLGRSLSEPGTAAAVAVAVAPQAAVEVGRGRRGSGFKRTLKKLLSPLLLGKKGRGSASTGGGGGGGGGAGAGAGAPHPVSVSVSWSTFSRSFRC